MVDSTTTFNGSSISFDSDNNGTGPVTEVFSFEERRPTADYGGLVLRLDVCRRLSPPPIPPWLMESPEKLRHLVANCSSWRKYTDLCSIHIPAEYPQALANGIHSDSLAIQWIPFIIVIFLVTLIVVSVIVMYTMYKSNRMKCPFLNDSSMGGPQPHNYCMPGGSMTTSVTIETQLSVCALEDDATLASMTPLHLAYAERVHHAQHDVPRLRPGHQREILLHPSELQNRNSPGPHFVSDLSSTQYYSSQSLPILTDKASLAKNHGRHLSSDSLSLDSDDTDSSAPNYVHIHAGSPVTSANSNRNDSFAGKNTVRGIMKRCQKAGVYLVHGVLGHKQQTTSKHNGTAFTRVKAFPPFTKLRRSFKQLRLQNHRQFNHSKSYDSGIACHETLDSSEEGKVDCETPSTSLPVAKINSNSSVSGSRIRSSLMKRFRPISRSSAREQKAPEVIPVSLGHDYANLALESHTDIAVKAKKSPFKKMKVPNLFRNLRKHREFI